MTTRDPSLSAVILAAGKGTRMKSDLPKVVHPIGGRPMVCAVVDACLSAGVSRIVVVVGYQQQLVRDALAGYPCEFAVQAEQLGTGHAVVCAGSAFESSLAGDTFVLAGDGPLIRPSTLGTLLDRHRKSGAAASLATSVIDNPTGYGRIVRDHAGAFVGIVEQKNATDEQRAIREVNPSYYLFRVADLFESLGSVTRNALTGEYYITDVPTLLLACGKRVEVVPAVPAEDILSINTLEELAAVDAIFRSRTPSAAGVRSGQAFARSEHGGSP